MQSQDESFAWVDAARARGLIGPLRLFVEAFAPLGIVGAQLLYVAQPLAGVFGAGPTLHRIAQALEDPQQAHALRQALKAGTADSPGSDD